MGIVKAGGQEEVVPIVQTMWTRAAHAEEHREADGWPREWTLAVQVPLWKDKGAKKDKNTWRAVTLLSVGTKVLAGIVADIVQEWTNPWRSVDQIGFMAGGGPDDAHQVTRRVAEETAKGNEDSGHVNISMYTIETAYPRVCRSALWDLMGRWGCDERLVVICPPT